MELSMPVNLKVRNAPDPLAQRLRERAERNRRSLPREPSSILEAAADERAAIAPAPLPQTARHSLTLEEVAARARARFPQGTDSSLAFIRAMRDAR